MTLRRTIDRGRLDQALLALYAALTLFAGGFVLLNGQTYRYRFVDFWWHTAAAEVSARTGVFAKEPFLPDAPLFAQFGLTDFLNAALTRLTGVDSQSVLVGLTALNVILFFVSSFAAGYLLNRRVLDGCVSGVVLWFVHGRDAFIGLGIPFVCATALLALFLALRLTGRGPAFVHGLLLGVTFAEHAFVGLVGVGIAGCMILGSLWRAFRMDRALLRGTVLSAGLMGVGFVVVSWRWLWLQVSLRAPLAAVNAHRLTGYAVDIEPLRWLAGGAALCAALVALARTDEEKARSRFFLWLAAVFLLGCLPPVSDFIASSVSWHMAKRVPLTFPYGLAAALGCAMLGRALSQEGRPRFGAIAVAIPAVGLLTCGMIQQAKFHYYLIRTRDYERHPYDYVTRIVGREWRGRIVLADPVTSYYLAGMLGVHVHTSIEHSASPAVDYRVQNRRVREALVNGPGHDPGLRVDAVWLDRRGTELTRFLRLRPEDVAAVWLTAGWRAAYWGDEAILLVPPDPGTP